MVMVVLVVEAEVVLVIMQLIRLDFHQHISME
jgi:hypothetical protein